MIVKLMEYTPSPDSLVAVAARLCYSSSDIETVKQKLDDVRVKELVTKLLRSGHESPFEHITFTFGVEGISRALSHQLVRHRMASYSQQSQRYVKFNDFSFVTPKSIENSPEALEKYNEVMGSLQKAYEDLLKIVCPEDARYILPNACTTKIIFTMNARSLYNFFSLRCCNRAQWEIRELAFEMLKLVKSVAPIVFSDSGPDCWGFGGCGEGDMSCFVKPKKI